MKVSVIIPTLNEASVLEETLQAVRQYGPDEIIVCDGGSVDATLDIARNSGARIVSSPPNRALQMNTGAKLAQGDLLLFLHADSIMGCAGYQKMTATLTDTPIVGGAFSLRIQSPKWSLQMISRLATLRSKYLCIVYGDQAIFARKQIFSELGGFSPLSICEDMDFFNKLKKKGKTVILDEETITSARRWQAEGIVSTTLRNWLIASLFLLGFPPRILSKWYLAIR